ncbi:MAG TPA: 2,3,4,5-tetrahydropyridine-2,6-dicarboxylate N-succinyltransferase [Gaiellales bacterium]|jgi:2,3,4,5-tetrahydropyridine-2-carboxylate N-succinyltransferase
MKSTPDELEQRIDAAFEGAAPDPEAVEATIEGLDSGELRLAEPAASGSEWDVHAWIQRAILLYFRQAEMATIEVGPFAFHDKIPLKQNPAAAGIRVVPPATVRRGAFVEAGAVLMPSYVNIGARVGSGTMIDTWATVGSGAQVGRDVHVAGGVGIGGVLEPPGARPVIVEDGCFIGSRVVLTEGWHLEREVVLGAGVVLTASTAVYDVTGPEQQQLRGRIPARSVVIPGVRERAFASGSYGVPCALVIGQRSESTDRKTSLNDALRDFGVSI